MAVLGVRKDLENAFIEQSSLHDQEHQEVIRLALRM